MGAKHQLDDSQAKGKENEGLTISLSPCSSLRIHSHAILRSTRSHERSPAFILCDNLVNLPLHPHRRDQYSFRVSRVEFSTILDEYFDKSIRKIEVGHIPIYGRPLTVEHDRFDEEEVRDCIPDRLVD